MTMISALAKKRLKNAVFDNEPIETLMYALMPNLERLVYAGRSWVVVSSAVREAAWKKLKGVEQTEEFGWGFSEEEVIRRFEEEIELDRCAGYVLPDEDDDL